MDPIIVTGASGAMGSEAVRALARTGRPVWMACRNLEKGERVRRSILRDLPDASLELMPLDLGSFASIRSFVAGLPEGLRFAGLFNNAGTQCRRFSTSGDGLERTWAVNYVGPYLLTRLLMPFLAEGAVVVNMVSLSTWVAKLDWHAFDAAAEGFGQIKAYAASKLALALFTVSLEEEARLRGRKLSVNMADPGIVDTPIIRLDRWYDRLCDKVFRPLCKTPAQGAAAAVNALLHPELSGELFTSGPKGKAFRHKPFPQRYVSHPLRTWLWDETARRCGYSNR